MAEIENLGHTVSADEFRLQVGTMEPSHLMAQDLVQQGAINMVCHLLANRERITPAYVEAMLGSLRENARLIREVALARGIELPFAEDQVRGG